ncbi:hypothetical protein ES708_06801 [subsurface metagenome]
MSWNKKLINAFQTPAERRAKYHICKLHGANKATAFRIRDFGWQKIARWWGYESASDMFLALDIDPTLFESWRNDPENPNAWNFDPVVVLANN